MSCTSIPEDIKPVSGFDLDSYMGTWYEIARLDHSFEKGLQKVTATYSKRDDGKVKVMNRGFLAAKDKWKEATGKARIASETNKGYLEVSFFGPFYGPYVIFELDKDEYRYAFVTSGEDYLWFLSRTPTVSDELMEKFRSSVQALGYPVDELIWVEHE